MELFVSFSTTKANARKEYQSLGALYSALPKSMSCFVLKVIIVLRLRR